MALVSKLLADLTGKFTDKQGAVAPAVVSDDFTPLRAGPGFLVGTFALRGDSFFTEAEVDLILTLTAASYALAASISVAKVPI